MIFKSPFQSKPVYDIVNLQFINIVLYGQIEHSFTY